MNRSFLKIFGILTFLILHTTGFSQVQVNDPSRVQFQMAQRFESMGDYQNALTIYLDIHKKSPKNYTYFDAVTRCYFNLKQFDNLVNFIESNLKKFPNNIQYKVKLGEAFLRKEDEQKAVQIWDQLIRERIKDANIYRYIAHAWMANRQYDRAIEIFNLGRKNIGDDFLYSMDLAQLYVYRLNYDLATEEYLRYLKRNPRQISYIEGRLASYKGDFQTYELVSEVLKKWIKREPDVETYRKLYVSFLVSFQNYEEAFKQVKELEKLKLKLASKESSGMELFRFGQTTIAEEQFKLAEKAFSNIIEKYPKIKNRAQVEYELARTLLLQNKIDAALSSFNLVSKNFPTTSWALEAQLTRGEIFLNKQFLPDSAVKVFNQILKQFPRRDERAKAYLALGDVEIARNNLKKATEFFDKSIKSPVRNARLRSEIFIKGNFKIAEVSFFRKDFENAEKSIQTMLQSQTQNLGNVLINDALELLLLIENNSTEHQAALANYAEALLLSKQNQPQKAAERFAEIQKSNPEALLAPRALFQSALLKEKLGDFLSSVMTYQTLIKNYPAHNLCDLSLWNIGSIYEKDLNDNSKAIENYEKILLDYPESMLVDKVRKRIRDLEGKT